jgi:hypothetical protein
MKKIFLLVMMNLCVAGAFAQKGKPMPQGSALNSNVGLGVRLTPDGGGFTGKFFLNKYIAIEAQLNAGGIFQFEGESFNAVGLVEYHIVLPDPSWRIFFGGGLHTGVYDRGAYWDKKGVYRDGGRPLFGIDAVGGVEYAFKKIPLGLSADLKPAINFAPDVDFFPHNIFGVAARFYF